MRTVAVLFARADSVYKTMPGCDVYDAERNALTYRGDAPIVAHPPCRAWASLRHCAKPSPGERDLAIFAIDRIRECGGVLEHPQYSTLWRAAGLPESAGERDTFGGWTLFVRQQWWGHRAAKATRLYIVGCDPSDIPDMPMQLGPASHTVGLWSKRDRATCRPSISKAEFEATPPAFAAWLVELARRCRASQMQVAA